MYITLLWVSLIKPSWIILILKCLEGWGMNKHSRKLTDPLHISKTCTFKVILPKKKYLKIIVQQTEMRKCTLPKTSACMAQPPHLKGLLQYEEMQLNKSVWNFLNSITSRWEGDRNSFHRGLNIYTYLNVYLFVYIFGTFCRHLKDTAELQRSCAAPRAVPPAGVIVR